MKPILGRYGALLLLLLHAQTALSQVQLIPIPDKSSRSRQSSPPPAAPVQSYQPPRGSGAVYCPHGVNVFSGHDCPRCSGASPSTGGTSPSNFDTSKANADRIYEESERQRKAREQDRNKYFEDLKRANEQAKANQQAQWKKTQESLDEFGKTMNAISKQAGDTLRDSRRSTSASSYSSSSHAGANAMSYCRKCGRAYNESGVGDGFCGGECLMQDYLDKIQPSPNNSGQSVSPMPSESVSNNKSGRAEQISNARKLSLSSLLSDPGPVADIDTGEGWLSEEKVAWLKKINPNNKEIMFVGDKVYDENGYPLEFESLEEQQRLEAEFQQVADEAKQRENRFNHIEAEWERMSRKAIREWEDLYRSGGAKWNDHPARMGGSPRDQAQAWLAKKKEIDTTTVESLKGTGYKLSNAKSDTRGWAEKTIENERREFQQIGDVSAYRVEQNPNFQDRKKEILSGMREELGNKPVDWAR